MLENLLEDQKIGEMTHLLNSLSFFAYVLLESFSLDFLDHETFLFTT